MRFGYTAPVIDQQENLSHYNYSFNNLIRFNDSNGLMGEGCCRSVIDFFAGAALTFIDNNSPVPTKLADGDYRGSAYETGRKIGNYLSIASGVIQTVGGLIGTLGAGGAEVATAGVASSITILVGTAAVATTINGLATFGKVVYTLNSTGTNNNGRSNNNNSQTGTNFSKEEKQKVVEDNRNKNDGKTVCENCGVETVKSEKSKKSVTSPKNETQIDHIKPKSKGGQGTADNGQVLCRDCNRQKSNN